MQANHRDNRLEAAVRSLVHRRGLRFRKNCRVQPPCRSEADLLFSRLRVAVFIDGCFWHGCPDHATRPGRNGEWWAAKLDANVRRDRRTNSYLRAAGWAVVRCWEHEGVERIADIVCEVVARNRAERSALARGSAVSGVPPMNSSIVDAVLAEMDGDFEAMAVTAVIGTQASEPVATHRARERSSSHPPRARPPRSVSRRSRGW